MANKFKIKVEGSHEHPFTYSSITGSRTGIAKDTLAMGVRSVDEYLDKESQGYKIAVDPSFHSVYVKEDYVLSDIDKLKSLHGKHIDEYDTPKGKVYHLKELAEFKELNEYMINALKENSSEYIKDISEWMSDANSKGLSSFRDQYVNAKLLYDLLEQHPENDVYSYLTGVNLAWWDLDEVEDYKMKKIIEWSKKYDIDLGVKLFLDGSFGAGTVGISKDYERVFKDEHIPKLVEFLNSYGDDIKYIAFHAIGNYALVDGAEIYKKIKSLSNTSAKPYVSHVEVVDEYALKSLDYLILKEDGYVSPQINFLPFDMDAYSDKYKDVFSKKENLVPMKTFISRYGYDKVRIGTDEMPLSLPYYLAAAYEHPAENEKLSVDELYSLIESNERKDKGEEVVFDADNFEYLLKDKTTLKEYLKNPYSELREKIDKEIIKK